MCGYLSMAIPKSNNGKQPKTLDAQIITIKIALWKKYWNLKLPPRQQIFILTSTNTSFSHQLVLQFFIKNQLFSKTFKMPKHYL
jgi:hypothetical protein